MTRFLRPLAARIGASPPDPSFIATLRAARVELGMWSPLLRSGVVGDPPNGAICGAARASGLGGPGAALPPDVDAFLSAETPPVVVGLGSAFSRVAGDLLRDVAGACADLDRRCLVIGHPEAERLRGLLTALGASIPVETSDRAHFRLRIGSPRGPVTFVS